jgi:hypothetical protein
MPRRIAKLILLWTLVAFTVALAVSTMRLVAAVSTAPSQIESAICDDVVVTYIGKPYDNPCVDIDTAVTLTR